MVLDIERVIRSLGVYVKQTELSGCRAATRKQQNGYLILVESRLDRQSQLEAIEHELLHILLGHLDDRNDLPEIIKEAEAAAEWLWVCDGNSREQI